MVRDSGTAHLRNGDLQDLLDLDDRVKFISIETATLGAAGTETLIAAVTSKKIRVLAMHLDCDVASEFRIRSSTSSNLTGTIGIAVGVGYNLPFNPFGWFETVAGELLNLLNGSVVSSDYSGHITYIEV